jgi:RNA recognition motif-containing protein
MLVKILRKNSVKLAANQCDRGSLRLLSPSISLHVLIPGQSSHRHASVLIFTDEDYDKEFERLTNIRKMDLTRHFPRSALNNRRVFVNNLDENVTWAELKSIMSEAGKVVRVYVFVDDSGRSKGSASVVFSDEESAMKALSLFDNRLVGRKYISVKPGIVKETSTKSASDYFDRETSTQDENQHQYSVFVTNLPCHVSSIQLAKHFRPYGNVVDARIYHDKVGTSIGRGYVQFSTQEEADAAKQNLHKSSFQKRTITVTDFIPVESRRHIS